MGGGQLSGASFRERDRGAVEHPDGDGDADKNGASDFDGDGNVDRQHSHRIRFPERDESAGDNCCWRSGANDNSSQSQVGSGHASGGDRGTAHGQPGDRSERTSQCDWSRLVAIANRERNRVGSGYLSVTHRRRAHPYGHRHPHDVFNTVRHPHGISDWHADLDPNGVANRDDYPDSVDHPDNRTVRDAWVWRYCQVHKLGQFPVDSLDFWRHHSIAGGR